MGQLDPIPVSSFAELVGVAASRDLAGDDAPPVVNRGAPIELTLGNGRRFEVPTNVAGYVRVHDDGFPTFERA